MRKKAIIIMVIILVSSFVLAGQQKKAILLSNDLVGLDNSLELTMDNEGLIIYIEAKYNRGPGIMIQYNQDIVKEPYELHDIGVVTDEDIKATGPAKYSIKSKSKVLLNVTLGDGKIQLDLGKEIYIISNQNLYHVELGPRGKDGKIETKQETEYTVQKNHEEMGFLGYEKQKWFPNKDTVNNEVDFVANNCPEAFFFDDHVLEATTYAPWDSKQAAYWYSYTIPLAKSRDINLMNYLILLTQRCDEGDPSYPVIHPVLLTLYYYDALMAAN